MTSSKISPTSTVTISDEQCEREWKEQHAARWKEYRTSVLLAQKLDLPGTIAEPIFPAHIQDWMNRRKAAKEHKQKLEREAAKRKDMAEHEARCSAHIIQLRHQEEAKERQVAALAHETGIDPESARLLYDYRRSHVIHAHSLTDDQYLYCEKLEERLATAKADRVVRRGNGYDPAGGVDWDDLDQQLRGSGTGVESRDPCDPREPPRPPLSYVDMSKWDSEPVPDQKWAVLNRVPLHQCALFSGEGAAGKSTVQLHLSAAHVLGRDWLGTMPEQRPALFIDAEDGEDIMHRRLAAITRHYGVTFNDLIKGGLHLMSLFGQDAILATVSRGGKVEPTTLYRQILEAVGDIRPVMTAIASSANVYAGSEIDRAQVQQFVSLLTQLGIRANGSVVLISHPSLTGITSESGISGTTQWHNAMRARFYMKGIKPENGDQPDNDLREIVFKKNQYGPVSESIILRYQNGLFLPVPGVSSLDRAASKADEVFLALLRRFSAANRIVSDKPSRSYAPALFAQEDEAKRVGVSSKMLEAAMRRLFAAGLIWNEETSDSRPSRRRYRLALKP
jgi:RecA-family ATPase